MTLPFLLCLALMFAPAIFLWLNRPRLSGLSAFVLFGLASCDSARDGEPIGAAISLAFGVFAFCLLASFPMPARTSP